MFRCKHSSRCVKGRVRSGCLAQRNAHVCIGTPKLGCNATHVSTRMPKCARPLMASRHRSVGSDLQHRSPSAQRWSTRPPQCGGISSRRHHTAHLAVLGRARERPDVASKDVHERTQKVCLNALCIWCVFSFTEVTVRSERRHCASHMKALPST